MALAVKFAGKYAPAPPSRNLLVAHRSHVLQNFKQASLELPPLGRFLGGLGGVCAVPIIEGNLLTDGRA
jgi:hypothetical protein